MLYIPLNFIINKGFNRSIVFNSNNGDYFFIPNDLAYLIEKTRTIDEWFNIISIEEQNIKFDRKIIDNYINFLYLKNCILNVDTKFIESFKSIDLNIESCSSINILDINLSNNITINQINRFLEINNIQNIIIRCNNEIDLLFEYLKHIYCVNNIELVLEFTYYNKEFIEKVLDFNKNVFKFIFYNSDISDLQYLDRGHNYQILFLQERNVFKKNFIFNLKFYLESQNFHSFYNKRLYLNELGVLNFYNESENDLETFSILKFQDFKFNYKSTVWSTPIKNILICRDCEFNSFCYNKFIPKLNKDNFFYIEEDCGYNPYISKFIGENGYKSLNESGVISNYYGFTIDYRKIEKLNSELW
jgi:hypothetical protein